MSFEQLQSEPARLAKLGFFEDREELRIFVFTDILLAQTPEQSHKGVRAYGRVLLGADELEQPAARLGPAELAEKSQSRDHRRPLLLHIELCRKRFQLFV